MGLRRFVRSRLIKDRQRFTDPLDTIKFICKEVWVAVWDKQVDNLRTNHRVRSRFALWEDSGIADFCSRECMYYRITHFARLCVFPRRMGRVPRLQRLRS